MSSVSPKIDAIDLTRAHFDWNSEESGSNSSAEHTYSVTVTSLQAAIFFCDIMIKRQGRRHGNFIVSATYFCKTDQPTDNDLAHAMVYHKIFAESIIWSKFTEWARFTLTQGGIRNIHLPIIPEIVMVKQHQP